MPHRFLAQLLAENKSITQDFLGVFIGFITPLAAVQFEFGDILTSNDYEALRLSIIGASGGYLATKCWKMLEKGFKQLWAYLKLKWIAWRTKQ
jgi:hypothetical protein